MPIRVECNQCKAVFTTRDESAGKRGKCPKCQAPIVVPAKNSFREELESAPDRAVKPVRTETPTVSAAVSKRGVQQAPAAAMAKPQAVAKQPIVSTPTAGRGASRQQKGAQLLDAFRGDIRRVRAPLSYRIGILITAVVMILLPIAYLALVAAAAFGVYYHASHHSWLLEMGSGRARLLAISLYIGPIIAGAIMVLFMLKPLIARRLETGRTRSLTRQAEPVLFSFVDRICQAVGARRPVRIEVDYQMNASAKFDDGLLKLVRNRLVLTIGVPLAAGLNTSQLAGVLAHEFGHFTQGAGLRVTYIIRSLNNWFVRVVYERDVWDEWLEETADDLDFRIGWMFQLARVSVFLSRRVLWVFMTMGHVVSGFMLRQMEYHADAHEARLVGPAVFESTTRKLERLGLAQQVALADVGQFVNEGHLPDDLPMLVLLRSASMPPKVEKALQEHLEEAKTGWFDTHPAPPARIRRAAREKDAPVFADDRPASQLFCDFKALSRGVTADLYRAYFGSRFRPNLMHPTEQLLAPAKAAPEPPREIEI